MLDIKFIRENPEIVKKAVINKNVTLDVDALLALDGEVIALITESQKLAEEKNQLTEQMKNLPKIDLGVQPVHNDGILQTPNDRREELRERSRRVGTRLNDTAEKLKAAQERFNALMAHTPQIPWEGAPIGKTEADNAVLREVGIKPVFGFKPMDHVDIIEKNGWGEFQKVTSVCGTRTVALKGALMRYEFALIQYVLDKLMDKGFTAIAVPSMAMEKAFFGAGFFPQGKEEVYALSHDNQYLSGTCETVINSMHAGEILDESRLPILYTGFSPCFRREAGAAGKDTRGLYRVHQFNKVEQFVICKNDAAESAKWHDFLLKNTEELLADFEVPYRVVECCTGDMGLWKYRMNDVECWRPVLQKYGETHSCSSIHEWQARRTNTRYRDKEGKVKFVHTLNNTGIATPRIFIALLENHQTADGNVRIPEKLRPYMGGREFL